MSASKGVIAAMLVLVLGLVLFIVVKGSVETAKNVDKNIVANHNSTADDISAAKNELGILNNFGIIYLVVLLIGALGAGYLGARE